MVFHIVNKSIANFKIFNTEKDFFRLIFAICYYQKICPQINLAEFLRSNKRKNVNILDKILALSKKQKLVEIIAYCLMPTHLHLLLKVLKIKDVSIFMNNILNSYTRYFNIKHKRKGPLWEGPFKKVLIETDEQLFHTTRYIHLNPVIARIVDKAEKWPYSSYKEYILNAPRGKRICNYEEFLDIEPREYKKFTEDQIAYQRELARIKNLILE